MSHETVGSVGRGWLLAGCAAAVGLLALHVTSYAFLTDDAYISFRYARNWVEGHGLVFNPGGERVEGYTNFLWVVWLAAGHAAGLSLERAAHLGSLGATAGLFALVGVWAWRLAPPQERRFVGLALLLLAATRSVAVWSTGGLETRLFEALVVAATLRVWHEDRRLAASSRVPAPLAAGLFGLAALTRPDGSLVLGSVFFALLVLRRREWRRRWRWLAGSAGIAAVLVGGHLLFRLLYYGDWVPNTYHAKVGGRLWPVMGLQYVLSFAVEYGVPLWLPFLVAGGRDLVRRGEGAAVVIAVAAALPHAAYILAIGGDHFEYRPLGLLFPFAYLLVGQGASALWPRWPRATAVGLAGLLLFTVALPLRAHREFPQRYGAGFPGIQAQRPDSPVRQAARDYLAPERSPLFRWPGLRQWNQFYRALLFSNTSHFVGVRQEEHAAFLKTARREGRRLAALVERGTLPADTYIAIDSVGAIPYLSGLRTLDRLGLTDATVARGEFHAPGVMAHGKRADPLYARRRGVDLWAIHGVHLLFARGAPRLARELADTRAQGTDAWLAAVGDDLLMLVWLPQGVEAARRRLPALEFVSVHEPRALRLAGVEPTGP